MMRQRRENRANLRRGLAAVELAVCLPVMVLLTLAMIETCTMIFLKQSLAIAAYEGAHTGIAPNATSADVRSACNGILNDRGVQGATVTITPADIRTLDEGEYFQVEVAAPTDRNAVLPGRFFQGQVLRSSAEFMMEMPST